MAEMVNCNISNIIISVPTNNAKDKSSKINTFESETNNINKHCFAVKSPLLTSSKG